MSTLSKALDNNGYPLNPDSLFIGIQRKSFPHLENFEKRLGLKGPENSIRVPFRRNGRWETLIGNVTEIKKFPEGVVIHYPQDLQSSPLKWNNAILWVPTTGTIGILSPCPLANLEEMQNHMKVMSQKHLKDGENLAYIIDCLRHFGFPFGMTDNELLELTQFKQIELLEKLTLGQFSREYLPAKLCVDLLRFLADVDKFSFQTADDFELVSQ